MTVATTDGTTIWAFRYASDGEGQPRSLYYSTDVTALREMYPDNEVLQQLSTDARLVVSEPLGDLPGAWNEVPPASYSVISEGRDDMYPFVPTAPASIGSR
jgi:glutamine amidotransferase